MCIRDRYMGLEGLSLLSAKSISPNGEQITVVLNPGERQTVLFSLNDGKVRYNNSAEYQLLRDFRTEAELTEEILRERQQVIQRKFKGEVTPVFIYQHFYPNGAALLYQNTGTQHYEEINEFTLDNLKLQSTNDQNKVNITLEPGGTQLIWMRKIDPGKTCEYSSTYVLSLIHI
eukprot:TRINITY_DN8951_c0_g1_i2.p1 TRINITY_DN8951_c0_g1~~TRINITY_DN8951_c0_g1_i2.p1  ORF type:complete len:194 (-),score=46.30 TRINITY_DN8951_c0_g1_i2:76-597(-)